MVFHNVISGSSLGLLAVFVGVDSTLAGWKTLLFADGVMGGLKPACVDSNLTNELLKAKY